MKNHIWVIEHKEIGKDKNNWNYITTEYTRDEAKKWAASLNKDMRSDNEPHRYRVAKYIRDEGYRMDRTDKLA